MRKGKKIYRTKKEKRNQQQHTSPVTVAQATLTGSSKITNNQKKKCIKKWKRKDKKR